MSTEGDRIKKREGIKEKDKTRVIIVHMFAMAEFAIFSILLHF